MRKPALAVVCAVVLALALASCSSSGSGKAGSTETSTTFTGLATGAQVPTVTDVPQTIDPCKLMTVTEATRLAGAPVKLSSGGGPGSLDCVYTGKSAGAEVTVKVDKDEQAANAEFPSWVQPIPGQAAGLTTTQIDNLGNEASKTQNRNVNDAIYVRRGAVLLKIGVYPPAGTPALRAAATTALGRV